jgi:hypothetical protein
MPLVIFYASRNFTIRTTAFLFLRLVEPKGRHKVERSTHGERAEQHSATVAAPTGSGGHLRNANFVCATMLEPCVSR